MDKANEPEERQSACSESSPPPEPEKVAEEETRRDERTESQKRKYEETIEVSRSEDEGERPPPAKRRRSRFSWLSSPQSEVVALWRTCWLVPADKDNTEIKLSSNRPTANNMPLSFDSSKSQRSLSSPYCLRPHVTIESTEEPAEDSLVYCVFCKKVKEGFCSEHPPVLVLNKDVPRDGSIQDRAMHTVPWPLRIAESSIEGAGLGVFTDAHLPTGIVFGPYEGMIYTGRDDNDSGYAWEMSSPIHKLIKVDSFDQSISNWLRFVNCSRTEKESNLEGFQYKGNIYYFTSECIKKGTELLIWYGDAYGKELQLRQSESTESPSDGGKPQEKIKENKRKEQEKVLSLSQEFVHPLFIPVVLKQSRDGTTEVLDATTRLPLNKSRTQSTFLKKRDYTVDSSPYLQQYKKFDLSLCIQCKKTYKGMCPKHPMMLLVDKQVPRDGSVKQRARRTAPWPLVVTDSRIGGAGYGVVAMAPIPKGLVLGPCEGWVQRRTEYTTGYSWEIDGRPNMELDATDTSVSNWTRYLNCPRSSSEQNLFAMQLRGEFFYITSEDIQKGDELLVWYGDNYGKWLQLHSLPRTPEVTTKRAGTKNNVPRDTMAKQSQANQYHGECVDSGGSPDASSEIHKPERPCSKTKSPEVKSQRHPISVQIPLKYSIVKEIQVPRQFSTDDASASRPIMPIPKDRSAYNFSTRGPLVKVLASAWCARIGVNLSHSPRGHETKKATSSHHDSSFGVYDVRREPSCAAVFHENSVTGEDAIVDIINIESDFEDSFRSNLQNNKRSATALTVSMTNDNSLFIPGNCARTRQYISEASYKTKCILDYGPDLLDLEVEEFEKNIYICQRCEKHFPLKYNFIVHTIACIDTKIT